MKTFFLTGISMLLLSCNSGVKNNNAIVGNKDTILVTKSADQSLIDQSLIHFSALDSIIVENEFVYTPFDKFDNMEYFQKMISKNTKINVELREGNYENAKDTIKTIYWGKSYIETQNNKNFNSVLLVSAIIADNNIVLRNNIRIGQDIKIVCNTFKIKYDSQKKYKFIVLTTKSDTAPYDLYFYFKDNVLVFISYSPYAE